VCFVNEIIWNGVSCTWFYGIFEGVKDFVQLIYQKIRLDYKIQQHLKMSTKHVFCQLSIIYQYSFVVKFHQIQKAKKFGILEID